MIGRRSSLLLEESFMVISRIFQPQDRCQVLMNAVPMKGGIGKVLLAA